MGTFRGSPLLPLAPLLYWALRRNEAEIPDRTFRTVLRTSFAREELRLASFRRLAREALAALGGAAPIVVRGFALAETAYPEASLRHCNDLDVLVAQELRLPALDPGLRICAHTSLLRSPYFTLPESEIRARCSEVCLAGIETRTLAPADVLLHVCGHALTSPPTLKWVPDAWFTIGRWPTLDWELFVETTLRGRLELPVATALSYLRRELDAQVPGAAVDRLRAAAAVAPPAARRAALSWRMSRRRALVGNLLRAGGIR